MPRPPNYGQERKDRERIKAAKKAEKLAARTAKGRPEPESAAEDEAGTETAAQAKRD